MPSTSFAFDLAFQPAAKAVPGTIAHQDQSGDLIIEGWGLNFDEDRQREAFLDGPGIQQSLDKFLAGQASLNFHHDHKAVLGRVLDARLVPGKGVWIKARVDHQPESSPLRNVFEQIRKGTITGLSFGGFFERMHDGKMPRIVSADFSELSCTNVPVGRGTTFSVLQGKALATDRQLAIARAEVQAMALRVALDAYDVKYRRHAAI